MQWFAWLTTKQQIPGAQLPMLIATFIEEAGYYPFICPAIVGLLCGFTVYLIEIMCCIIGGVNQCASPNLSWHVGSYISQVSVESWMSLGWVSPVVGHHSLSVDSQFFNSRSLLCWQITDISPAHSQCHTSGSYYSSWSLGSMGKTVCSKVNHHFALRKLFLYSLILKERIHCHVLLVITKGYRVQVTTI